MAKDEGEVSESKLCSLLIDAGVKLLAPQPSVDGILSVLDSVEGLLSSLGQDPSQAIRDALLPIMKGLISDWLFKHCNMDVKVSAMSCIHELVRIAAPDTPYKDECMKEIFQQTVKDVFGKLSTLSDRSYAKALQILHTVAKVRSSLILLNLGCYGLIIQMIQIFLDSIQPNHPDALFSNMEDIITWLIQESYEVSLDLLKPLLIVVNKENQAISPPCRILAEKVLKNCSMKLKPYLTDLVEQLRKDAEACTYVIASIWPDVPVCDNVMNEAEKDTSDLVPMLEDGTSTQRDSYRCSSVDEQVSKTITNHEQKKKLQIVDVEYVQTDTVGREGGPGSKACVTVIPDGNGNTSKTLAVLKQVEPLQILDDKSFQLDTLQTEGKIGTKVNGAVLAVGRKSSSKRLMGDEQIEQLHIVAEDSLQPYTLQAGREVLPGGEEKNSETLAGNEHIEKLQIPLTEYVKPDALETEGTGEQPCQDVLPGGRGEKAEEVYRQSVVSGAKTSSEKLRRKSDEKQKRLPENVLMSNSPLQSNPAVLELTNQKNHLPKKKSEKDIPLKKRKDNLSDSGIKGNAIVPECDAEFLLKGFRKPKPGKEYREELIGSRVMVWWPDDHQFYEGVVEMYDLTKKEHKVAYLDGDVENLRLENERWLLLDEISPVRNNKKPRTAKEHDEEIVGSEAKVSLPHDHEFFEGVIETYDHIKKEHKVAYLDGDVKILRLGNECWILHDEISAARHYKNRTAKEYREEIVGSRVKVWWPCDHEFYEGAVESYDPVKKEHKVAYGDGDVETLRLVNECWLLHVEVSVARV